MTDETTIRSKHLHHVAYATRDSEATYDFYANKLGMKLLRTENHRQGDGYFRHFFFDMGAGECLAFFEIQQRRRGAGVPHRDRGRKRAPGLGEPPGVRTRHARGTRADEEAPAQSRRRADDRTRPRLVHLALSGGSERNHGRVLRHDGRRALPADRGRRRFACCAFRPTRSPRRRARRRAPPTGSRLRGPGCARPTRRRAVSAARLVGTSRAGPAPGRDEAPPTGSRAPPVSALDLADERRQRAASLRPLEPDGAAAGEVLVAQHPVEPHDAARCCRRPIAATAGHHRQRGEEERIAEQPDQRSPSISVR